MNAHSESSSGLEVGIEATGDLRVDGRRKDDLEVRFAHGGALKLATATGRVSVVCPRDAVLSVPEDAAVRIAALRGDAHIGSVRGGVWADDVGGILDLRRVGPCRLGRVRGDVHASQVAGELALQAVGGSAHLEQVEGGVTLPAVDGDLHLREVRGAIQAVVAGDAYVTLGPSDAAVDIVARGALHAAVPDGTNAEVRLHSEGGDLRLSLPAGVAPVIEEGSATFTLGSGGPVIHLRGGSTVSFVVRAVDPFTAAQDRAASLAATIEGIEGRLYARLDERRGSTADAARQEGEARARQTIEGALERLRARETELRRAIERRRAATEQRGRRG